MRSLEIKANNRTPIEIDQAGGTPIYIWIEDPTANQYLASLPENVRAEVATRAITLGLRALETSTTNGTVIAMTDQVQAAANRASEHVNAATETMQRAIKTTVDRYCAEDGILAQNMRKVGSEALDPDKAETLVRLRDRIGKDIKLVFEPLAKQLADTVNVNDETKPFGQMSREIKTMRESLAGIKTHLDNQSAIVASSRGNATFLGRNLEDFTLQVLGEVAAHQGETLEDIRNIPGLIERSKAGDILAIIDGRLTPGATVKVVIEDKNRKNSTLTALLAELDRAMANRGADVGLGVLVNTNSPAIFYQGNHVVVNLSDFGAVGADNTVHAELLRVGYDMARFMAIQAARNAHQEPVIDLHGLKMDIDDLSKTTQKFSTLKDNHTRIETAVGNARSTADEMKADFIAVGTKLRKRITDALKRTADSAAPNSGEAAA